MIVDEEVADYIREIFKRIIAGDTAAGIAKDFNQRGIDSPMTHWRVRRGQDIGVMDTRWFAHSVSTILKNPAYIGTLVSQKQSTVSYKNHTKVTRPKEEWVVIENHHPPIVEIEQYEIVQKLRERRRKPTKTGDYGILNGLLFCSDCSSPLRINRNRGCQYYVCNLYSKSSHRFNLECTRHGIRRDEIEKIALAKIRETVSFASKNREAFSEEIRQNTCIENDRALKAMTAEINKSEKRVIELDKIIKRIYEDNVIGRLSDERFNMLLTDYENEQTAIKELLSSLKSEIAEIHSTNANLDSFFNLVDTHINIPELTAELARMFISKIVVHEPIRPEGRKHTKLSQEVHVHFNHIGEYI